MSDDIVERLRDKAQWMNDLGLQDEAADEIERLRSHLDEVKAELLQVYEKMWAAEAKETEVTDKMSAAQKQRRLRELAQELLDRGKAKDE